MTRKKTSMITKEQAAITLGAMSTQKRDGWVYLAEETGEWFFVDQEEMELLASMLSDEECMDPLSEWAAAAGRPLSEEELEREVDSSWLKKDEA